MFLAATRQQEEKARVVDIACNQEPAVAHDDGFGGYANVGHEDAHVAKLSITAPFNCATPLMPPWSTCNGVTAQRVRGVADGDLGDIHV
jgi:hypothetical protein